MPGFDAGAVIETERLILAPLRVDDADELAVVLSDERLHRFIGGGPVEVEALRQRYARLVAGSGRAGETWLNWTVRRVADGQAVGTVQATVTERGGETISSVAWIVGIAWQGKGYASEAAVALIGWLGERGVARVLANIHPDHVASATVAAHAGLRPSDDIVDGERVWTCDDPGRSPGRRTGRAVTPRRWPPTEPPPPGRTAG